MQMKLKQVLPSKAMKQMNSPWLREPQMGMESNHEHFPSWCFWNLSLMIQIRLRGPSGTCNIVETVFGFYRSRKQGRPLRGKRQIKQLKLSPMLMNKRKLTSKKRNIAKYNNKILIKRKTNEHIVIREVRIFWVTFFFYWAYYIQYLYTDVNITNITVSWYPYLGRGSVSQRRGCENPTQN